MTQVKIFAPKSAPNASGAFEAQLNEFLAENKDTIVVKDIKYTAETLNPSNSIWKAWTAMIIYEVK